MSKNFKRFIHFCQDDLQYGCHLYHHINHHHHQYPPKSREFLRNLSASCCLVRAQLKLNVNYAIKGWVRFQFDEIFSTFNQRWKLFNIIFASITEQENQSFDQLWTYFEHVLCCDRSFELYHPWNFWDCYSENITYT